MVMNTLALEHLDYFLTPKDVLLSEKLQVSWYINYDLPEKP